MIKAIKASQGEISVKIEANLEMHQEMYQLTMVNLVTKAAKECIQQDLDHNHIDKTQLKI